MPVSEHVIQKVSAALGYLTPSEFEAQWRTRSDKKTLRKKRSKSVQKN